MGFFDLFKKKKERTLYDELMDIPGMKEQIELFEIMSEANKGGCTTDEMPEGIGEFGLVPTNPIPVNTVQGSILYLGGLRAMDGTRVNNKRLGSLGAENIKKLEEVNLIQLNKGKIVIMKSQYMIMKKELEYYVNGENVF